MQSPEEGEWGQVKLLDFGLAESVELLKESKIKGTLDYMAPEILRGEPYSFSADLYSLGVILYQLVTGRLPYQAQDPAVLISNFLEKEPVAPKSINSLIPPEVEQLILRLLEKNPNKRDITVSEIKEFFAERIDSGLRLTPEWIPLLESGDWIPAGNIGEELLAKIKIPSLNKGKITVLCGQPGAGQSRSLQELYFWCEKENYPVVCWSFENSLKESSDELCQRLHLLCTHSSAPEMTEIKGWIEKASQAQGWDEKKKLLARIMAQLPLIFILDSFDFQADSDFLRLLCEEYVNQKSKAFISIKAFPGLATQLEKFIHSHPETERIELVQLPPLKATELRRLLESKLPGFKVSEKFFNQTWHISGGNPYLALDYLKKLWQEGRLTYQRGKIKPIKAKAESNPFPESFKRYREFIASSLSESQSYFLRKISILGHRFDLEAGVAISGEKIDDCYDHLRFLLREGILLPQTDSESIQYEFSPPGLQEMFYGEVPEKEKVRLHHQAAEYLESLKSQGETVPASALERHFTRCGNFDKAFFYSILAAEEALKSFSKREILAHFKNAYAVASRLPDTREKILKQGQALRKRAHFWKTIGNFQQARLDYRQILKLFDKNSRQKILAEAYKDLGDLCRLKNSYRKGMVYLRRAEEIYRALDDKPELAHTLNNIGNLYWIALQYDQALEYLNSALELHRSLGNLSDAGSTLNNLAGVYLALNQHEKSIQYYRESLEIHRQLKISEEISRVLNNLGVVYLYTADYHKALDSLLESLSINQQTANLREQVFNLENLGECYQRMGNPLQAVQLGQQGIKLAEQIGFTLRKGRICANLGRSYFEMAEYTWAGENYQQALDIATQLEDWETQAWVQVYLAEFYLKLNQIEPAKENLAKACPILERLDDVRVRINFQIVTGLIFQREQAYESAQQEYEKAFKLAEKANLLEERLSSALALLGLKLEQENQTEAKVYLSLLEGLFKHGEFGRYQARFSLARAKYFILSRQSDQALLLVETALEKAGPNQNQEESLQLVHLGGRLWQQQKNYEKAYLCYERGVTILKRIYQKIKEPELKQSYMESELSKALVADFKKIAVILAGTA
ncbi:MAG: hypothetical protein A2142_09370 [candidate division Zixibacteria bacterium RBG_16_48_11]|nr:MAG: hypothetical protein A2142_09370 [candidate division Zixibacteria bacterium RBG_16_48_11]